jgi:hypothetical protein
VSTNTRPDEERTLFCKLTEDELLRKGDKLAACIVKLEEIEKRKKAFNTQIKAEQEVVSASASLLSDEIEHRRELQPVTCSWERGQDQWVCHRVDTGEVVDTAPITMADKQERLFS